MAVIPVKNAPALIGYYLGVASLIPMLGLVPALPAIICGLFGIRRAKLTPEAAGMGHAISAIVMGILGPALWFAVGYLLFQ